ncbi:FRE family ferric-chelate reductase [Aspergillus avenaceus]|uniref:FRE family ferric-chelate reductase n=1 Tax=Aspergillus avenaceus TaxID=36643 RepID=A0A5N6U3N9_ASPAV|nr:FRE family ferric-chelate reductase [Aspergillus avenaceus]
MWFRLWLSLVCFVSFAYSALPVNERCVTAVYTAYGYITFAEPKQHTAKAWLSRCQNPLTILSIYASADIYCTPPERTAGFAQLGAFCRDYAHTDLIPRKALADNLTDDAIKHMRVVDYGELRRSEPVDSPVLLSSTYYQRMFDTIDTWEFEVWTHTAFGLSGYAFWGVILTVATLHRFTLHIILFNGVRINSSRLHSLRIVYKFLLHIYHWLQTHVITPGPLPSRGRRVLCWTFPTRIEALIISAFWLMSTILCFICYRLMSGNIYWSDISAQLLRYAADRTGILSFANLPLLWLFAGRNNIFIWATGWSFATFNLFHRHIAWIATIQGLVHTVLYLVIFIQNGNAWRKMQKPYLFWGTIAMVAMLLLSPFAVEWFRRRTYETFLVLHILFSVAALVGCFYHTIIFEDHEYWGYLWPAVAIWSIDRVLRVVRIVYYNLHVHAHAGKTIQYTTSSATYDSAADVIRLEVVPGSSRLKPTPGQYYYLYQPFRLTGWENHPFTLGSWSYETGTTAPTEIPPFVKDDPNIDVTQVPLLSDGSSGSRTPPDREADKEEARLRLVFWIRPFDGWTRHLREQCVRSGGRHMDSTMLLEGPYGEHFPLWTYESVLIVVGGTGIAAAVPYIHDHLARCAADEAESSLRTRDIHLVWTSRQEAFLQTVAARELRTALCRDDMRASFYVTQSSTESDECATLRDELSGQHIEISPGRPDVQSLILTHAQEAQLSDCSAAVLMCGPPAMADEVRAAVHQTMQQGYRGLQYIEESFSW